MSEATRDLRAAKDELLDQWPADEAGREDGFGCAYFIEPCELSWCGPPSSEFALRAINLGLAHPEENLPRAGRLGKFI